MSKTTAEIRNRALQKLGRLARSQTATGALADDMDDAYNEVYAELKNKGITAWGSAGPVPDEYVPHVVNLMCLLRSEGISNERYQRLALEAGPLGDTARLRISGLISGEWENPLEYTDY